MDNAVQKTDDKPSIRKVHKGFYTEADVPVEIIRYKKSLTSITGGNHGDNQETQKGED